MFSEGAYAYVAGLENGTKFIALPDLAFRNRNGMPITLHSLSIEFPSVNETDRPATEPPRESNKKKKKEKEEEPFSCDHRITLFILNQKYFQEHELSPVVYEDEAGPCHPPYWAAYIAKTNLLLVVVKRDAWYFSESCTRPPNTIPQPTEMSTTSREPCHKLALGQLTRRRLEGCFTYHEGVSSKFAFH